MRDFAMLDLSDDRFSVCAITGRAHDWMERFYTGYERLRGKVLIFTLDGLEGFVHATNRDGLTIEGVSVNAIVWKIDV